MSGAVARSESTNGRAFVGLSRTGTITVIPAFTRPAPVRRPRSCVLATRHTRTPPEYLEGDGSAVVVRNLTPLIDLRLSRFLLHGGSR